MEARYDYLCPVKAGEVSPDDALEALDTFKDSLEGFRRSGGYSDNTKHQIDIILKCIDTKKLFAQILYLDHSFPTPEMGQKVLDFCDKIRYNPFLYVLPGICLSENPLTLALKKLDFAEVSIGEFKLIEKEINSNEEPISLFGFLEDCKEEEEEEEQGLKLPFSP